MFDKYTKCTKCLFNTQKCTKCLTNTQKCTKLLKNTRFFKNYFDFFTQMPSVYNPNLYFFVCLNMVYEMVLLRSTISCLVTSMSKSFTRQNEFSVHATSYFIIPFFSPTHSLSNSICVGIALLTHLCCVLAVKTTLSKN